MWAKIAHLILRNRLAFLLGLAVITIFMGYIATRIELSYEYARVLPEDDISNIQYQQFKKMYGEDGTVLVIGFSDKDLFKLDKFNAWDALAEEIKAIEGIKDVLSISRLYNIHRNDSLSKFEFKPIINSPPKTQEELDSLKEVIFKLPFYQGLVYNKETNATVMAVTFHKSNLNSEKRLSTVKIIKEKGLAFAEANNVDIHFSGMPYIRTEFMRKVKSEMMLFLLLAVAVTAIILLIFFRSGNAVLYSMIVVIIGVIWSLGTLELMGYKITILTGLIPPLIIVIGLPNCIFLINKYQEELRLHGNKMKALSRTVTKVGLSNFLANVTTAIGFGVFYFTHSSLLVEFGVLAAMNVMLTYFVALIFIPIILSFLPVPSVKQTSHLSGKRINKALVLVDKIVHHHRKATYIILSILTLVSFYGMTKIKLIGYVVDDLPKDDPIYSDLRFFEKNFNGVLPFELSINTKKPKGVFADNGEALYKIKSFQKILEKYEEFSKPVSVVEVLKFAYQSYKDGNPKYYILPAPTELKKLEDYTSTIEGNENKLSGFLDSTKQYTRVSFQMADVGSARTKELLNEIQPKLDSIFPKEKYEVFLTGHSVMFVKSNDYLFKHLFVSLIIAIVLILLIGMVLFRSIAIIILSKIPCLIPLAMTAGIMGFFDINFKPSTILIFSIAFGIASDGTIYILTEYRAQLRKNKLSNISSAVSFTIKETGLSMIYTAIILFCGFAIFIASGFGGTVALGTLISITLLVSLCTNLILLPAILLSLERKQTKEFMQEPLIDIFDEEEDIDLNKLEMRKNENKHNDSKES